MPSLTKKRNFFLLVISAVLAAAIIACGSLTGGGSTPGFAGSYDVSGTNPDNSNYFGDATFVDSGDGTFAVTLNIDSDPPQTIFGTGTINASGQLVTVDNEGFTTTYTLQDNGNLTGAWDDGAGGQGTEVLTRR